MFSEKEHKKIYIKWLGMVEKVHGHVNPTEVEKLSHAVKIQGVTQDEEEEEEEKVEIPEVPLEFDD